MADDKPYRYSKESKSPYLLIGLLLILIVVMGWALINLISGRLTPPPPPVQNVTPPPPPPPPPPANETPKCDDNCIMGKAVAAKDYSQCAAISDDSVEQECYSRLSGDSLDACKLVKDDPKRDSCLKAFAAATADISLCDQLTAGRDQCRLAVDPCYGSENMTLCQALRFSEPSRCNSETDCLFNYSLTKKDSQSCSLIQNPVVSKACESSILHSDRCSGLTKAAERDYCYQLFAINTGDELTCTQITQNTPYAIDCYATFAIRRQNYTVCDVFSLDERWACYRNYSLGSGDVSACYAIDELATTNRFICGFEFAKKFGDPSACQVITESLSQRDTCYQGSIIYSNENLDWHNCDGITDFNWRNKCYNQAAILYDDVTLCEYIDTGFAHDACIIAYNNYKNGQAG